MQFKIWLRGKVWHYRGTIEGRRVRGSTGTTDKARAQRIAAEAEAAEWKRHLDGAEAVINMAQVALAYLDAGKPSRFLGPITEHWKETLVRDVTPEAVRLSARKLYPTAKAATWNRQVIKPTRAMINFAAQLGWCAPIRITPFPEKAKIKTPATLEWVLAFAAQAKADNLPHLAALALFMFGTGARIGEATALCWGDMDLGRSRALIRQTKTDSERTAHLPPEVVASLANIPSNRRDEDKVFGYAGRGSVKTPWASVIERAGIAYLTPHCLRHGFATTLLHKGFDVATIAKLGGWKDAATVIRTYAHAKDDPTVTNALFGTELTQPKAGKVATIGKTRRKAQ